MPAVYNKQGLHFVYPESWTVDEDQTEDDNSVVTVYGPGGAFWSLTVHPEEAEPQALADAAVEALRGEYEQLDIDPIAVRLAGKQLVGYELNFYYLDLTSTAWFHAVRHGGATYLIYSQAEDRDLDDVAPVFAAIITSLLRG